MPIKFPKFSRRKSAANTLNNAAYEPANTSSPQRVGFEDDEHTSTGVNPYGGYIGQSHSYNSNLSSNNSNSREIATATVTSGSGSYSTGGYYGSESSNRLSSSSTIPSADFPHTPASTDDHFGPRRFDTNVSIGGQSSYSNPQKEQTPNTPTSFGKRSVGGSYPTSPPHRMPLSPTEAPRLETKLDSTSFEDMFSGYDPNKQAGEVGHTAPKLATSILPSISADGSGATSPASNSMPTRKPVPAESQAAILAPPKSYNPAAVAPKVKGMVKEKVRTFDTFSKPLNMYNTEATGGTERWAGRPSEEGLISPPAADEKPQGTSPRQSRNLTHTTPAHQTHGRKDSLTAPPRNTRLPRTPTGDLKRASAVMRRQSNPSDDDDAAVVSNNVQKPQGAYSVSSPTARKVVDRLKDRDSGWEETVASGSSSLNSLRDNASASSKGTTQTNITYPRSGPATRQNTDENFTTIKTVSSDTSSPRNHVGVELKDGNGSDNESISEAVALAAKFEDDSANSRTKNEPKKVMTKAQFDRYRQQQDDNRRLHGKAKSDTESESEEEDYDSDTERNKEVLRQRQKQEAHLSVYRQQMMKITGSSASTDALGQYPPSMSALNSSMPQINLSTPDDGSDDDEVPLGILMAHGFPNKNRPPTRLANSSSQPNLRGASQQQQSEGGGGRLPVFARHLPADPYNYGAGLVDAPTRLTMNFGRGGAGSVSGGSVYGGGDRGSVYGGGGSVYGGNPEPMGRPGGLIGEIALAEEMKAARKNGSPGINNMRPSSSGVRNPPPGGGLMGFGGGMQAPVPNGGMMGMMPPGMMGQNMMAPGMMGLGQNMMAPGMMGQNAMGQGMPPMMGMDPSQVQMQQQMQQMMQMQMQWMQQMQAQQMMPPGMGAPMMPRPNSIAVSQNLPLPNSAAMRQRTMSMVDPMLASYGSPQQRSTMYSPSIAPSMNIMPPMMGGAAGPGPGYTPSIAPSERSTIGLPSRYRPVSQVPGGSNQSSGSRTSTMGSNIGHNWNTVGAQQARPVGGSALKNTAVKGDDDDDDSAWEEMEKKKREKKDGWKKRKDLKSMLSFGSSSSAAAAAPAAAAARS